MGHNPCSNSRFFFHFVRFRCCHSSFEVVVVVVVIVIIIYYHFICSEEARTFANLFIGICWNDFQLIDLSFTVIKEQKRIRYLFGQLENVSSCQKKSYYFRDRVNAIWYGPPTKNHFILWNWYLNNQL